MMMANTKNEGAKRMPKRMPKGWRRGFDESVSCQHRNISCCPECSQQEEVVEVAGRHYWIADATERQRFVAELAMIESGQYDLDYVE